MLLLVAVEGEGQVTLLDISQMTTSPVVKEEVTNGEPLQTGVPLTYQIYDGVPPPLTGVAVNTTFDP